MNPAGTKMPEEDEAGSDAGGQSRTASHDRRRGDAAQRRVKAHHGLATRIGKRGLASCDESRGEREIHFVTRRGRWQQQRRISQDRRWDQQLRFATVQQCLERHARCAMRGTRSAILRWGGVAIISRTTSRTQNLLSRDAVAGVHGSFGTSGSPPTGVTMEETRALRCDEDEKRGRRHQPVPHAAQGSLRSHGRTLGDVRSLATTDPLRLQVGVRRRRAGGTREAERWRPRRLCADGRGIFKTPL